MALSSAALAADLAAPPPPPLPPPMWTAFTPNAGYDWAASQSITTTTTNLFTLAGLNGNIGGEVAALGTGSGNLNSNGFIGGGQMGYSYQFTPNLVVGVEADIDGLAGAHKSASLFQAGSVPGAAITIGASSVLNWTKGVDYLGTVRGRIGYLVTPTLLIFGTGGLAYGGVSRAQVSSSSLGLSTRPVLLAPLAAFPIRKSLDGRWRLRMDVSSQLERQGRISLL